MCFIKCLLKSKSKTYQADFFTKQIKWYKNVILCYEFQIESSNPLDNKIIYQSKNYQYYPLLNKLSRQYVVITQQNIQMYFDKYPKNNINIVNPKYQSIPGLTYAHNNARNFQFTPHNSNTYFNSNFEQVQRNSSNLSYKPHQQVQYQPKPLSGYVGNMLANNVTPAQQQQQNNNIMRFRQQLQNPVFTHQPNQTLKRRDSISFNTNFNQKQSLNHSPSNNNRNYAHQNSFITQIRPNFMNQLPRSMEQLPKNIHNNNKNLSNLGINKDKKNPQSNKTSNIDFLMSQQNFMQNLGNGSNSNYSHSNPKNPNINPNQNNSNSNNRKSSYIKGAYQPTKTQNGQFQSYKKNNDQSFIRFKQQSYKKMNQKAKVNNTQEQMYRFQLRNVTGELHNYNESTLQPNDPKYYTPVLEKQVTQRQQITQKRPTNDRSKDKAYQFKSNNYIYADKQRKHQKTEKQMFKSPSFDALLNIDNTTDKQKQNRLTKKLTLNEDLNNMQFQNTNEFISKNISNQPKVPESQQIVHEDHQNRSKTSKNYHLLIQNLQKKFNEQKKSSVQSLEQKQKFYILQLNKRDYKIKRIEAILQNNKSTIQVQDETIKQLTNKVENVNQKTKKQEISTATADSTNLKNLQFEYLKKQINNLKQQLKIKNEKYMALINENNSDKIVYRILKQQNQRCFSQIKQLKITSASINKQNQLFNINLETIKKQNANLHYQYNLQLKSSVKRKEQEKQNTKVIQQLSIKNENLLQRFKQLEIVLEQTKNELKCQEWKYQKRLQEQRQGLYQTIQSQRKDKQSLLKDLQVVRIKTFNLQIEVDRKTQKLRQLEQRIGEQSKNQKSINTFEVETERQEETYSPPSSNKDNEANHKQTLQLLDLYDQKYREIAQYFNLTNNKQNQQRNQPVQISSLTTMPNEDIQGIITQNNMDTFSSTSPKQYVLATHPLIKEEIVKIHKDLHRLVAALRQNEIQSQKKSLRLSQLDKTVKKQANKINSLIGQINVRNQTLIQVNKMQVLKQIMRLNQKYAILDQIDWQQQSP